MEEMIMTMQVIYEIYPMVMELDEVQFLSVLGMLVDMWGKNHGLSSRETCQLLEGLMEVQKEVHANLGMDM